MTPNDDLSRWGEPPASEIEMKQAERLAELLAQAKKPADAGQRDLLEVDSWLELMVTTVLTYSGLVENVPCPADAGGPARAGLVDLRLRISRFLAPGQHALVSSTHAMPTVLRDLARMPDDPDRVTLHTGDRVRIEAVCDHAGYLTVFNVGPTGTLNLLWPLEGESLGVQPAHQPLRVANVMLTPPAGREKLYAVWSRVPLARQHLQALGKPGVSTRDMQRMQDAVEELRPDDWHAVVLVLDHVAGVKR